MVLELQGNRRAAIDLRSTLERNGWEVVSRKITSNVFTLEIDIKKCHTTRYASLCYLLRQEIYCGNLWIPLGSRIKIGDII